MPRHTRTGGATKIGTATAPARKKAAAAVVEHPKKKKMVVDVPQALAQDAAVLVAELHVTTSTLVRRALEKYIRDLKQQKLEREMEEGYLANASVAERTMKDFRFVDAEDF